MKDEYSSFTNNRCEIQVGSLRRWGEADQWKRHRSCHNTSKHNNQTEDSPQLIVAEIPVSKQTKKTKLKSINKEAPGKENKYLLPSNGNKWRWAPLHSLTKAISCH